MDSEATSAPTFTPTGLRRSGHDDYWIITDDYAVRVHKRPRKSLYVPSLSTTGGTGQPDLARLSATRTTKIVFKDSGKSTQITDNWRSVGYGRGMSTWTGETKFELLSDKEAQEKKKDATTLPQSPLDAATDRWERDGTTWVRVHEQP